MKRLACLLADPGDDFSRMLELELCELYERVLLINHPAALVPCELLVIDLDHSRPPTGSDARKRIGYSRRERAVPFPLLHRPFRIRALRELIAGEGEEAAMCPSEDFRTVTVGSDIVTLSEREALILRLLYEAEGAVVPRGLLATAVFPNAEAPEDAVNVYIHYLRKKLERNRKRVIRAHRGGGYSLLVD